MKSLFAALVFGVACATEILAAVAPVSISAPDQGGWTGERIRILVELRATGSFAGTAGFDVPEIPRSLLIKTGNPVVGSKEIEGESWFVQTHEFALFSQTSGELKIPPFTVRFEHREGFTGPSHPVEAETESLTLEIRRPPGTERIPFLITTRSFDVSESWDTETDSIKVGDVIRRTISQQADGLTGMALIPAQTAAPNGVRAYAPEVNVEDSTTRGALRGRRDETLTFLVQKSGEVVFPELVHNWWNPDSERLETKTLPSKAFHVVSLPEAASETPIQNTRRPWLLALVTATLFALSFYQRRIFTDWSARSWLRLRPPEHVAGRKLLSACHRNDPAAAQVSWNEWSRTRMHPAPSDSELQKAVLEMQRVVFGPPNAKNWKGEQLAQAFKRHKKTHANSKKESNSRNLPPLNGS